MPKILKFDEGRRARGPRGRRERAGPTRVKVTPSARRAATWVLDKKFGAPTIHERRACSIAREVELDDPFENMGAPAREGGRHQDQRRRRGDGTTTATVLAQALVKEGPPQRGRRRQPARPQAGAIEKAVAASRGEHPTPRPRRSTTSPRSPRSPASPPPIPPSVGFIADANRQGSARDGVVTVEESNTFGMGPRLRRGACSSTRATSRRTS